MGLTPPDRYSFVGRMWISTPQGTYYPKYPLGLPLLFAMALWMGGGTYGPFIAYLINPIAMALALTN